MKPTAEQLARINQKALVPLNEDQVYVFPAKVIGNNLIPKYKMRLSDGFLRKMADQAKEGVALLVDHPWEKYESKSIPYGRTFDSRLQMDGDELALYADHYMVMGQQFDGIKTDDLASGIDAGTIFDTSAGFITTVHKCSLCGLDYYNSPCPHLAGVEYDAGTCEKIAEDGYLMENSIVFDGAYEGAGITLNQTNTSKKETAELIPLDHATKSIEGDGRIFYVFSNKTGAAAYTLGNQSQATKEDETMGKEAELQNSLSQKEAALSRVNGMIESIKVTLGVATEDEIAGKLAALTKKAELGDVYCSKVIDEACGAGVRALGEAFNTEAMKLAFSNLPVAEVEKIRDSYEAQAKVALGGGGRHTHTDPTELPENPGVNPNGDTTLSAEQQAAKTREEARAALARTGNKHLMKEVE